MKAARIVNFGPGPIIRSMQGPSLLRSWGYGPGPKRFFIFFSKTGELLSCYRLP